VSAQWAAVLDGDIEGATLHSTRAAAEAEAAWIRNHPACRDRVAFGLGGVVRVVRVTECEWTGEMFEVAS
jgi:hypothetical protein